MNNGTRRLEVKVDATVWYMPEYDKLPYLHNETGPQYESEILAPAISAAARTTSAPPANGSTCRTSQTPAATRWASRSAAAREYPSSPVGIATSRRGSIVTRPASSPDEVTR